MIDAAALRTYASDFLAFAADLTIPAANGPARFGDCMVDFQRERFEALAPALHAVAAGRKPFIGRFWWEATKGASKDSDLAVALIWALAFTSRPLTCQIGAADQDQADELRKAAKELVRLNSWLGTRIEVQSRKIVNSQTGSEAEIIAADVAGSHGSRPDILVVNELSHVRKREFAENLLDNATKVPCGVVVVATNAGTAPGWQFTWREHARTSAGWSFHKYERPAPWLSERQIQEARIRNSPNRFARLWAGQWTPPGGDSLPMEWIDRAVVHKGPLPRRDYDLFHGAGVGVDLGLQRHHAGVVVVVSDHHAQKIHVARVWSFSPPVDISLVEDAIREAGELYGVRAIVADPWQFASSAQQLGREGFEVILEYPSEKVLSKQATALMEVLRNEQLKLYPDELLLKDLRSTAIVDRAVADITRGYRLEWPVDEDGHCDRAAALCNILPYALAALALPPLESGPEVEEYLIA